MNTPELIQALLNKLPVPDRQWPLIERIKWLRAMNAVLDLLYAGSADETIVIYERQPPPTPNQRSQQ